MARQPEGWRIHRPPGRKTYLVRFTHNGARVERSTGAQDPGIASEAAARIYADHVQREPKRITVVKRGESPPLEDLVASWLSSDSTIGRRTVKTWTDYGRRWRSWWESLVHITDVTCEDYRNERLRQVMADTVRKELGALRRFLQWCTDQGYLQRKINVPFVPKKATGTRHPVRRRVAAPELSPEEIEAWLALLPEWSRLPRGEKKLTIPRHPVKARFVVAYETGLRPTFLDDLSVPEHYRKGAGHLRILLEVDKNQFQREVPLSKRAREALDAVCPESGLIFGKHNYRNYARKAALKVLPRQKADVFTTAHLRSARATHVLESTGNIPGTMHLFGWKKVDTATKYTRSSQRAAEDTVRVMEKLAERAASPPIDSGGSGSQNSGGGRP
jgi:integrase